jgi:hypothetical protein
VIKHTSPKNIKERERITPLATKQAQTRKKQATIVNNGMVDMARQMETL